MTAITTPTYSKVRRSTSYRARTFFFLANPALKFVSILLLAFLSIFINSLASLISLAIIFSILYLLLANLRLSWLFGIFGLVLIMSLLSGINLFFFGAGQDVIWQFAWRKVSHESVHNGLLVCFRTMLLSMLGLLFSTTIRPTLFCYALMRQLHLPPVIAYGCLATIRMIPMMAQDYQQLHKALKIRGRSQQKSWWLRLTLLQRGIVTLMAQVIRRSYRMSIAVVTKGFNPKAPRTYYYEIGLTYHDLFMLLLLLSAMSPVYFLGF